MRDKLAEAKHWENMIRYNNEELAWSKESTLEVIEEKGDDIEGVNYAIKMGAMEERTLYLSQINSLYSAGAPIEEIQFLLPATLEAFFKSWTNESGYFDILKITSISIILDAPEDVLHELAKLLDKNDYSDYLLEFLLGSVVSDLEKKHDTFIFPKPYGFLRSVIDATTKEEALRLLEIYLKDTWYAGHSDEDWYNGHKRKGSFYSGYWSFESGAIAKILNLDDTGWENMQYYPYDLVHYSN